MTSFIRHNKEEHSHHASFWPLMLTLFLGTFTVMLSSSTINVALPYFMDRFDASLDLVKWTMTGFMLAMGVSAPLTAYLGERFSYKRLYIYAMFGFTLVSALATTASSIQVIIVIRVAQGCFGGVTVPATMAMLYQIISRNKQVLAVSLWNIAPSLAPAIGPTVSGFLLQVFSWRAIFSINIVFGIITLVMALHYLPSYKLQAETRLDKGGIILSLLTGVLLLTAFSEGAIWGWQSPEIVFLLITGFIAMGLFIYREFTTDSPALDLSVFRFPRFTAGLLISVIVNVTVYAGTLLTPLFLQRVQMMTPLQTGLLMLPPTLTMALVMPITGHLLNKIGGLPLILTGIGLITIGSFELTRLEVDTSSLYLMGWMAVRYVGVALATMPVNYLAIAALPKQVSGHASSIMNWMKQMFSCLSVGVFSSVLTVRTATHVLENQKMNPSLINSFSTVQGIDDVYLAACVIALVAIPFVFILKGRHDASPELEALQNE